MPTDLHGKILAVMTDYLGSAGERFVNRQIQCHLCKDPDTISRADIPALAIRIRSGLLVLTNNESVVEEAYQRITGLADSQN